MQALLISPYSDEASVLTVVLQQAGFRVRVLQDLQHAIAAWPEQPTEIILLTLAVDDPKALTQVEQMRAFTAVPIIVVTDMASDHQIVTLLERGADLVILKPYSVRVLLAQIRATLRRTAGMPFFSLPTLTQSDVILDPSTRKVAVGEDEPRHLTQLEFRLLYTLMTHAGQVIPAENIVEHVWGYGGDGNRDLVRGLVQRLRSKIEPDPKNPRYIRTEPGLGYYFQTFPETGTGLSPGDSP